MLIRHLILLTFFWSSCLSAESKSLQLSFWQHDKKALHYNDIVVLDREPFGIQFKHPNNTHIRLVVESNPNASSDLLNKAPITDDSPFGFGKGAAFSKGSMVLNRADTHNNISGHHEALKSHEEGNEHSIFMLTYAPVEKFFISRLKNYNVNDLPFDHLHLATLSVYTDSRLNKTGPSNVTTIHFKGYSGCEKPLLLSGYDHEDVPVEAQREALLQYTKEWFEYENCYRHSLEQEKDLSAILFNVYDKSECVPEVDRAFNMWPTQAISERAWRYVKARCANVRNANLHFLLDRLWDVVYVSKYNSKTTIKEQALWQAYYEESCGGEIDTTHPAHEQDSYSCKNRLVENRILSLAGHLYADYYSPESLESFARSLDEIELSLSTED